jgi:hypothetical protein
VTTYRIIRHFLNADRRSRVVDRGLTLAEAQEHCRDPETSSKTATSLRAQSRTRELGPWFDGYEEERP